MSFKTFGFAAMLALSGATAAMAVPSVDVRGAALRLVVIPEARSDVSVTILHASSRLPLKVHSFGQTVTIDGDIGRRVHGCHAGLSRGVGIWGRGVVAYDDLPQVVVRTPMAVKVEAGEAVYGEVGRSDTLDLTNRGCGDWTAANVTGRARVTETGSGNIKVGQAGSADLSVTGSGDVALRDVRGGVTAVTSGSGNITVASLRGPLTVRIAGSGDFQAKAGEASEMVVSIAGSGGVRFGGVARALRASIAGSGDVSVARVDGPITKHVFGSGEVQVGR